LFLQPSRAAPVCRRSPREFRCRHLRPGDLAPSRHPGREGEDPRRVVVAARQQALRDPRAIRAGLAGRGARAGLPGRGGASPSPPRLRPTRRSGSRGDATMGGRPVLPAHRQAVAPPDDRGGSDLQEGPPPALRGNRHRGARAQPACRTGAARRGRDDALRSKVPGTAMEVRDVSMDFLYGESFTESSPEAYERLILDVPHRRRKPCSRGTRRSSTRGGSSTAWRSSGRDASPTRTGPATGGRPRPSRCWHATAGCGGGREDDGGTAGSEGDGGGEGPRMTTLWDTTGTDVVKALAASGAQRGHWPSQACSPSSSSPMSATSRRRSGCDDRRLRPPLSAAVDRTPAIGGTTQARRGGAYRWAAGAG